MRDVAWTGLQIALAAGWFLLLWTLMGSLPFLAAYALAVVPPFVLLGGGLLYWRVKDARRRRRLLEEEWRR